MASAARQRLQRAERVLASPLLEAEVRASLRREAQHVNDVLFAPIEWIHPNRSLRNEITRVLDAGYTRGADCWHLATALFASAIPEDATFLTFDNRQRDVAEALGFQV